MADNREDTGRITTVEKPRTKRQHGWSGMADGKETQR
jgi:hypothetical protein